MTETTTTPTTVARAQAEFEQARERHDDLRAGVVAGDPSLGPGDLADAAAAVDFAKLLLEAALAAEAERSADANRRRIDGLTAQLENLEHVRSVVSAAHEAREAFDKLFASLAAHQQATTTAGAELLRMDRAGIPLGSRLRVDNFNGLQVDLDGERITNALNGNVARDIALAPVIAAARAAGHTTIVDELNRLQTGHYLAELEHRLERHEG